MMQAVAQVSKVSLPHASLTLQTPLLRKVQPIFTTMLPDLGSNPQVEPLLTRPQYAVFVTDFIALVAALIPELQRLGPRLSLVRARSIATVAEEELFWGLWGSVVGACSAFNSVAINGPDLWTVEEQPHHVPLYAVFHSLLEWLLPMTRSAAWRLMQPEHGTWNRDRELTLILKQPGMMIATLASATIHSAMGHLHLLPPSLLPLICCITCEQLCSIPQLVDCAVTAPNIRASFYRQGIASARSTAHPVNHILGILTGASATLANVDRSMGHDGRLPVLRSPAVLHFLKAAIIMHGSKNYTEPAFLLLSIEAFNGIFKQYFAYTEAHSKDPMPAGALDGNRDDMGLPVHINPLLSDASLVTDTWMLHVLTSHMQADVSLTQVCRTAQCSMLSGWLLAGRRCSSPTTAALSAMAKSVVGLAKQCTTHMLGCLRDVHHSADTRQQGNSCGLEREQSSKAGVASSTLHQQPADTDSIRALFLLVSCFLVDDVCKKNFTREGESHTFHSHTVFSVSLLYSNDSRVSG